MLNNMRALYEIARAYAQLQANRCGSKASLKAFTWMYARQWTGVQYVVHEEAKRVGRQLLSSWLQHHRIQHCARCLGLGTLRKTIITENDQQVYLCEGCLKSGQECGAARPALDLARP